MKIEVLSIDDKTGKIELDLDEEARERLIEVGFNKIMSDAIDERRKTVEEKEG